MRVARFRHEGRAHLGAVLAGDTPIVADLGAVDPALPDDVGTLLAGGALAGGGGGRTNRDDRLQHLHRLVAKAPRLAHDEVRLEAPIPHPPSFLAVGLNYQAHATETGRNGKPANAPPVIFNKQPTCVTGPYDPIVIPYAAPDHVDYEGELGVVIATRCRAVPVERAPEVVAGYLVVNDVSVRDWQYASNTWTMGKGWDTHGPTGPWLVTPDEIADPHQLRIRTWVDGDLRQDASTADMIHNCWELIAYLTTAFTLLPGTIITTGTPAGVGYTRDPPALLHAGSRVAVEIDGVGRIDNPVVDERSEA